MTHHQTRPAGRMLAIVLAVGLAPDAVAQGAAERDPGVLVALDPGPELVTNDLAFGEPRLLGFGRVFDNDYFGDGHDRWRTGSYQLSVVRGRGWDGTLPARPGELLELRLRSEVIVPSQVVAGLPDRPYVGATTLGVHTHVGIGPVQTAVGADVTAIGPQTLLSDFQEGFHDLFGLSDPIGIDTQLGNAVYLTGVTEAAWPVRLSPTVTLRPFAAAQYGTEDLVRLGGDVILGQVGHTDLMVRDSVTGQLVRATEDGTPGLSLVAGADWSYVDDSVYLPENMGYSTIEDRTRARVGVHWQFLPEVSFFYGLTWLSEEFEGQPNGQFVGGLKLNFNY